MNRKLRLLLADNYKFVADACKQLLEPEFDVVGIATDGRTALQEAVKLRPDMVILEVCLPQLNGLEAAEQIRHNAPALKIVFLTANSDVDTAAEAFRRGAAAYVLKQSRAEELITAVRGVMRGESYLSPLIARETIAHLLCRQKQHASTPRLTRREAEVLQLLSEGRSMKEVASILEIGSGTVAFHKYKMMEKLGINTNAGLLQYAMRHYMAPVTSNWAITDANGTRLMEAG